MKLGLLDLEIFGGFVSWPWLGCVHAVWPWEISLISHPSLTWFVVHKDLGYFYFLVAIPVTMCLWCTVWMPLVAVDLCIVICWLVGRTSLAGWLRLGIDSYCWPILTNQGSPALSHSIMGHPAMVSYWGSWLCDFRVGCSLCRLFLGFLHRLLIPLVSWCDLGPSVRHDRDFMSRSYVFSFLPCALTRWPVTRLGLDFSDSPVDTLPRTRFISVNRTQGLALLPTA